MTKTALVILAEGAEEMEAVITIDILRRGGVEVAVAGLTDKECPEPVVCSRQVTITPDYTLDQALSKHSHYDAIILPGGAKGAQALAEHKRVGEILRQAEQDGRLVAAICAGPISFPAHHVASGKKITSHPSVKDKFKDGFKYTEDRVVQDGNIITSRGPGTAMEFALKIVEHLQGRNKVDEITPPLIMSKV